MLQRLSARHAQGATCIFSSQMSLAVDRLDVGAQVFDNFCQRFDGRIVSLARGQQQFLLNGRESFHLPTESGSGIRGEGPKRADARNS